MKEKTLQQVLCLREEEEQALRREAESLEIASA